MGKVLLFLLLLCAALLVWRVLQRARVTDSQHTRPQPRSQRMLPCRVCGVHVPEIDALRVGEAAFCCEEHRAVHHKQ